MSVLDTRYHYHQFPKCVKGATALGMDPALMPTNLYGANALLAEALRASIAKGEASGPCGVAFDGFPIHGPLIEKNGKIVFAKSSYTGEKGHLGHPKFVEGSGDLDMCNGLMTPDGYRYVLCCEMNGDEVVPIYPYTITMYKGSPELLNMPPRMRGKDGVKNFVKQNEVGSVDSQCSIS